MRVRDAEPLLASVLMEHGLEPATRSEMAAAVLMEVGANARQALDTVRLALSDSPAFLDDEDGMRESQFRARYLINAVKRKMSGVPGHREEWYFDQHREAKDNRERARRLTHTMAEMYGNVIGHYGISDEATTPDCEFLIGKNFRANDPPDGLYPGARHSKCRCTPGPPIPGAEVV